MKASSTGRNWLLLGIAGSVVAMITCVSIAQAENFPVKPVRLIVPFSAGGGADLNARRLAQRLNSLWKQPVIVHNVAGAAGNLAAATTASSQPDGYTLFFASLAIIVSNPALYKKLPFDPDRDFAPVVLIGEGPHVLLVSSASPATKVSELIALAKERPGSLNFGSGGVGTSLHLAGELLKAVTGIDIVHVPYKGAALAIAAMVGDEIQMLFDNGSSAVGHIRAGRVRGLAIASQTRSGVLPDVPTFEETGIANFRSGVGHGIYVRSGTPAAVIRLVNRAINTVFEEPEYKKQMAALAYNLAGGTPEQLRAHVDAERKKWLPIIRKQGIKAN